MNIQIHNITDKQLFKLTPLIQYMLEKFAILFIPLPLFMIFTGTLGIIEKETPDSLASISSMGSSFIAFLDMHTLIITGALGVTFIIWLVTRKMWSLSEEYDEKNRHEEPKVEDN